MLLLKLLLTPPTFADEEKTHQAYLLHVILLTLIIIPIPYIAYVLIRIPEETNRALTQVVFSETINVILFIMLRRGYVRQTSIIQVVAFWLFFTATAATGSGVHSSAYLLGNGLVITIAGILLGSRGALAMTIIAIISGGIMAYAELNGLFSPRISDDALSLWIISILLFSISASLQNLASSEVRSALNRANASEERYRLISRVSSDYTFSTELDPEGNMLLNWVAGAFESMTGYKYEEYVAGGGWLAYLHPDDREKDAQGMATLRENQPMITEVRTYKRDGELLWVRVYGHPVWDEKQNRLAGIMGAVQDITEQKESEEKLQKVSLQQSAILNNIPDMAWLKDKESRYVAVNEQFAKVSGIKLEDITGKTDLDIWRADYANHYREDDRQVMHAKESSTTEELQLDHTGREYWIETIKTPILNAHGEVVGTAGIAREITQRKQAEMEREALITELTAKNAELERFTYTVSHDLKSPLVTITGFLGYLEKDALEGNAEKIKSDISRITNAAEKMQALLNDLLELSRIGRLMNTPENIPFEEIVKEALENVRGQLEANKVKVEVQSELPIVHGDKTRLIEVVQNLVENAAKFSVVDQDPRIEIGTVDSNENDEATFFVRDHGIGIQHEFQERIFGLFNKLDQKAEGTGIGLTLVKRIIEVHNGKIWVESEPGKGATFYFTLPTSQNEE